MRHCLALERDYVTFGVISLTGEKLKSRQAKHPGLGGYTLCCSGVAQVHLILYILLLNSVPGDTSPGWLLITKSQEISLSQD